MRRRTVYLLIFILVLFGFALWSVVPLDRNVLGREGLRLGLDLAGGSYLVYQGNLSDVEPGNRDELMDGVKGVIERRINALGITEPIVEIQKREGEYNIVIQLPGIADIEKAKEMVGLFTILEFREQDAAGNWTPATGTVNNETLTLTSRYFKENTDVAVDQYGKPLLVFEWDETGAQLSKQITTRLLGKQLAIYLGDEPLQGEDGHVIAPVVQAVIEDKGQIEGLSLADATELKDLLNAGRIDIPLGRWVNGEFESSIPLYERTVTATLGQDSIQKSIMAAGIGIVLLLIFMLVYYRLPGLVACLSLGIYGVVLLAIFKLVPVTLTLSGLAGFIVSLGMAVDANVLIFERTKEELRGGRSLGAAVEAGFSRAWTAIRDSNITTFIACIVLFWLGGTMGAFMVRGFALILFIGVALSMFTAITVTRTFLRLIVGSQVVTNPAAYGVTSVQTVRNTK
ncbi:MAG: protein translocase subunit SecD [Dehalococcoidia bacterium]|nr:protein translocase subunit SecD [Dehalococcoidia bacterium]